MLFRVRAAKVLLGSKIPFWKLVFFFFQKRAFLELDSAIEKSFHPVKNPLKACCGFVKLGVAYPERSTHVKSANMHNLSTMPVLNKNSETLFLQSLRAPQKNYRVVEGFWKYSKKKCSTSQTSPIRFLLFS